jgi:hypothetical protein
VRSSPASEAHDLTGAICPAAAALPGVVPIIASALELTWRAAAPATSNETATAAVLRRVDLMLSMRVTPLCGVVSGKTCNTYIHPGRGTTPAGVLV